MPGVGGGVGCVGSGGEVDHGELSGGAHREEQEQRAAPLLCVGRSAQRDRPITYVTPLGAGKLAGARATLSGSQGADVPQ